MESVFLHKNSLVNATIALISLGESIPFIFGNDYSNYLNFARRPKHFTKHFTCVQIASNARANTCALPSLQICIHNNEVWNAS